MADLGVLKNKKSSGFGGGAMEDRDFDEEQVWNLAKESDDFGPKTTRASKDSSHGSSSSAWPLPAAPRKIPRANAPLVQGSSAPINIPDWSKVYGKNCNNKGSDCVGYGDDHLHDDGGGDDDDEDEDDMVPPHEWIARKLARSQISSFSVCEGMGRTLKGRDLSKVRNAILTKTGFIE